MVYILVPHTIAAEFGLSACRRHTPDGRVLLNEVDLQGRGTPGATLEEKVSTMGGELLTAAAARKLTLI
jgi:hypothetical protein